MRRNKIGPSEAEAEGRRSLQPSHSTTWIIFDPVAWINPIFKSGPGVWTFRGCLKRKTDRCEDLTVLRLEKFAHADSVQVLAPALSHSNLGCVFNTWCRHLICEHALCPAHALHKHARFPYRLFHGLQRRVETGNNPSPYCHYAPRCHRLSPLSPSADAFRQHRPTRVCFLFIQASENGLQS